MPAQPPRLPSFVARLMVVAAALAGALIGGAAGANVVRTPHVEAELLGESRAVPPGKPFRLGLRLRMIPGWHTYWINPGDAGMAITIEWHLPPGWTAGPIRWPAPRRLPVIGGLVDYGYDGEVTLASEIRPPAGAVPGTVPIAASATWLVCAEVCVPEKGAFTLPVRVAEGAPAPDPAAAASFARADAALPRPAPGWTFAAERGEGGYRLVATPPPGAADPGALFFYAAEPNVIDNAAPQPVTREGGRYVVLLARAKAAEGAPKALHGVWEAATGWGGGVRAAAVDPLPIGPARPPSAAPAVGAAFAGTLVLALMGGLILNLMPCVFPVLGLKVLGFVSQAGANRRKVVAHGLAFTGGVLISFWILAGLLAVLRAGGAELGWGFQLQSPAFVFVLAAVMLAFALNMSGAYEFGLRATGIGGELLSKSGLAGTFFTGFLATVVATPCAAPFLAPALGAAVVLPAAQSFLVFTAIGLGLSAPYLLLSLFPRAVKLLPRPGAWMETFKQVMAFPLYATVVYLLWVLAGQVSEEGQLSAALGLVLVAMGCWAYGRWTRPEAPRGREGLAYAALIVLAGAGAWLGWPRPAAATDMVWEKWSPAAIARAQAAGRPVYVDFTARWCATCQANKQLVFHSDDVLKTFARLKVAALRADWTNQDPAITAELARWRRSAIPFVLVYKPGRDQPIVLPEVLTPDIVLRAVAS